MLVYLCPLSSSAQFVSVHSLSLLCRLQTQDVDPMVGLCCPALPSIGFPCRVWRDTECGPASQMTGQH